MASLVDPKTVLELLGILISPQASATSDVPTDSRPQSQFDRLLHQNLQKLEKTLAENEQLERLNSSLKYDVDKAGGCVGNAQDIRWTFTCWTVELLKRLKVSLQEAANITETSELQDGTRNKTAEKKLKPSQAPPMSADTLSMGQQKVVHTSVQFIVCLGIVPHLDMGVGMPLDKRSGFAHLLQGMRTVDKEPSIRTTQLVHCMRTLLTCLKQPSLGPIILSKHLGDLLAALCQICYRPSPRSENDENNALQDINHSTEDMKQDLQELVGHVYPPLVIRELMILQGAPRKRTSTSDSGQSAVLPPAPPWLRKACSNLLVDRLVQPRGVQALIHSMLQQPGTGPPPRGAKVNIDWKKCDAIAKMIANCPLPSRRDEYFAKICPQVLDMIQADDKSAARHNLRVAVVTMSSMLTAQAELAHTHLINPLLTPLLMSLEDKDIIPSIEVSVLVSEHNIAKCVEDIYCVFVIGCDPQNPLVRCLQEVIHSLFLVYLAVRNTVVAMRSNLAEILTTFLKWADQSVSLSCLELLAFGHVKKSTANTVWKQTHPLVSFVLGPDGGVQAVTKANTVRSRLPFIFWSSAEDRLMNWPEQVDGVLSLLTTSPSMADLAAQFLLHLLQDLTDSLREDISKGGNPAKPDSSSCDTVLLDLEDRVEMETKQIRRNLILLHLLAALSEKLGPSCLKKTGQVVQFVKVTLERGVQVLSTPEEELTSAFESETLTMAMGLLMAIMGEEIKISPEDRELIKSLLPLLQTIADMHPDGSVVEMATDLRIAIATHGAVWSEVLKNVAKQKMKQKSTLDETSKNVHLDKYKKKIEDKKQAGQVKPLIEVISSDKSMDILSTGSAETQKSSNSVLAILPSENLHTDSKGNVECVPKDITEEDSSSEFQQGLVELCDPLIPVRGHGLIRLHRLYEKKDTEALSKSDMLLNVFLENIDHEDSYIYLAAIQGLASLAYDEPQKLLPILLEKYSASNQSEGRNTARHTIERTLKLGEVLVKTSKSLGPTIPKYRDVLLAAMLSGAHHSDDLVRASAVSNLGEVCHLLHFSVGNVIHEVFACVSSLVKSDPSVNVRRAAAMVTTQLLQGLGPDALKVLDSVLRDLYRLLKLIMTTEADDSVRLHVQMALQELDAIMKQFLFPPQNLQKHIRVLDPPPGGLL